MVRIVEFWAKGYRSLKDVRIDTDRPFNVFYGPNGAGKSNILVGIETLFRIAEIIAGVFRDGKTIDSAIAAEALSPFAPGDRSYLGETIETTLGAAIETNVAGQAIIPFGSSLQFKRLSFRVSHDWLKHSTTLRLLEGTDTSGKIHQNLDRAGVDKNLDPVLRALFGDVLPRFAFSLVSADRYPKKEADSNEFDVLKLLRDGRLLEALFRAGSNPDARVRERLKTFRALMEGEPFRRPPFDLVQDPQTKQYDLREPFQDGAGERPFGEARDVSLRLAGLGIAQVYSIVAQLLLPGTDAAGIEEPEAHLHAPTSGRHLRTLFERIVNERHLSQLFVATHSNLFDLDPEGYHDVSHDSVEGTKVSRKPLSAVDEAHLYEPGPAKHALQDFLRSLGEEDVGLRTPEGEPITTTTMIDLLQRDDELALAFLREMNSAATRLAMLKGRSRNKDE